MLQAYYKATKDSGSNSIDGSLACPLDVTNTIVHKILTSHKEKEIEKYHKDTGTHFFNRPVKYILVLSRSVPK